MSARPHNRIEPFLQGVNRAPDPGGDVAGARAWILTDGKAGDEIPCLGLAEALGLDVERKIARPGALFAALAPYGPVDPGTAARLGPPFPQILLASGRRAVPALRHVRRASGGGTFTVFLKNPRRDPRCADLVWAPLHDGLRGANVISTLLAPHRASAERLAGARAAPDPRVAALAAPRAAFFLGGDSNNHRFGPRDVAALVACAHGALAQGFSLMATTSRRTPPALAAAFAELARAAAGRAFLYDGREVGAGANPYFSILALADTILVTADSTNMVGEVLASAAPVRVFEPSGGCRRLTFFLDELVRIGALRRWDGGFAPFSRAPLDMTAQIAQVVGERWRARREKA